MIPKGVAWQELRSLALRFIPAEGLRVHYSNGTTLNEWRTRGSYQVLTCSRARVLLQTSETDIKSALFCDAEYLLDHAAEHRMSVKLQVQHDLWASPTWTFVTVYYWSFFSALAITRLVAKTTWFLDKDSASIFQTLASSPTGAPPGGAFNLDLLSSPSIGFCQILLKPMDKRLHEGIWLRLANLIESVFLAADGASNVDEFRFWLCLRSTTTLLDPRWMSDLRNSLNYRPGSGYLEVTQNNQVETLRTLRRYEWTFSTLLDVLEQHTAELKADPGLRSDKSFLTRLAAPFSIAINAIAEELHADLIGRISGDTRWAEMRARFIRSKGAAWPA